MCIYLKKNYRLYVFYFFNVKIFSQNSTIRFKRNQRLFENQRFMTGFQKHILLKNKFSKVTNIPKLTTIFSKMRIFPNNMFFINEQWYFCTVHMFLKDFHFKNLGIFLQKKNNISFFYNFLIINWPFKKLKIYLVIVYFFSLLNSQ